MKRHEISFIKQGLQDIKLRVGEFEELLDGYIAGKDEIKLKHRSRAFTAAPKSFAWR